uniref:Large ribosomal subunit protein bL32c n=1 Tax=Dipelta elegans TaxID=1345077 RepID=A0A873HQ46_9DIPS|nr:ribosomal protein L32 [Dipelta elegans]QOZ39360.1 ribosomal protein L32 [Dipelta elegans]QOZ39685.1 ribosomal protein L32 [Dipelta elegans]
MAVPKKRTSISKKRIRKNIWKGKGYWSALKALSLGKSSLYRECQKVFLYDKQIMS